MPNDNINGALTPRVTINGVLRGRQRINGNMREGGGTSNYEELENLPAINGVELIGDQSAHDLGLALLTDIPDLDYYTTEHKAGYKWIDGKDVYRIIVPFSGLYNGMQLSIPQNDYDTIIKLQGIANYVVGGNIEASVNVPYYHNSNYYIRIYYQGTGTKHLLIESTGEQNQYYNQGFAIFEYTKN